MSTYSDLFQRNAEVLLEDSDRNKVKVFTGLNIKFKIEKDHEGTPNKGVIQIFNLSESSRDLINDQASRPIKPKIKLSVGYQGQLDELFIGNIEKVKSIKKGTDWITTLEAGDGEEVILKQNYSKSYKLGTNEKDIVSDVLSAMGELGKDVKNILDNKKSNFGVTIDDTVGNILDEYIGGQDKQWSIQNENVTITKVDETTQYEAIVLNKFSGLIGWPIKTDTGIKLRALIQVGFIPGRGIFVRPKSRSISHSDLEFYRIEKVVIQGETRSKNWYADIEAKTIEPNRIIGIPIETNEPTRLA